MNARISVALCTHNGAAFLIDQLHSIATQTVEPDEIVISDDASTDDTRSIIQTFIEGLPERSGIQVTLLLNPVSLGVTRNFERALLACTGEFIALCDQDDIWHQDRLARGVSALRNDPSLCMVNANAALVNAAGQSLGLTLFDALGLSPRERNEPRSPNFFRALLRRNLVTGATTMIRRNLLAKVTPIPEPWLHDEWLAIIAATLVGGGIGTLADPLIDYRQHGMNQIGASKLSLRGRFAKLVEPRGDRYEYLLLRSTVLRDRLIGLNGRVMAEAVVEAGQKAEHQAVRAGLPTRRVARVRPILRELSKGRYTRFSRGSADVVRDLIQPA